MPKFQVVYTYQAICYLCKKESDFLYANGGSSYHVMPDPIPLNLSISQ